MIKLTNSGNSDVVKARMAWSLGRTTSGFDFRSIWLADRSAHRSPRVRRHIWEALLTLTEKELGLVDINYLDIVREHPRRVRAAGIAVAAKADILIYPLEKNPAANSARLWKKVHRDKLKHDDLDFALDVLKQAKSEATRLELIRLMQVCLGDVRAIPTEPDVYAGYTPQKPLAKNHPFLKRGATALIDMLPAKDANFNREAARLLGMLQPNHDSLLGKIAQFWTEESSVEDDIHYLIVLSRLPGDRSAEVTNRTARALARLHHKMRQGKMFPSRFWPTRVGETFSELLRRDSALSAALVNDELFNLPQQSLFAERLQGGDKQKAVERLIAQIEEVEDWTNALVRLTSVLPVERRRELLHELWDHPPLRETIVLELAKAPRAAERSMYLQMLKYGQPRAVLESARALKAITVEASPTEIATAVASMRQFSREQRYKDYANTLDQLLAHWTRQKPSPDSLSGQQQFDRWAKWIKKKHPDQAKKLESTTIDLKTWLTRLEKIDWTKGNAMAGKKVFERRSCARCHSGHSRLGPDLAGIGGRFSRNDLFTAIVDPNKDVSPAYRVTQIVTKSGRMISGQLLYSSPTSSLVQTTPDTTVRITAAEIETIRKSPHSPMPQGLLREATDQALADLYAWLKTLKEQ